MANATGKKIIYIVVPLSEGLIGQELELLMIRCTIGWTMNFGLG